MGADKSQQILKANYGFLNSPKKQAKLTILSKEQTLYLFFLGPNNPP